MKNIYLNPFFLFCFAFLSAISLYSLSLSDLYDNSDMVITFVFFLLCFLSLILGFVFNFIFGKKINKEVIDVSVNKILMPNYIFMIAGFAIDCIGSGAVPLISILKGDLYGYKNFGLKTFHVFYISYMSAFAIISFERYLGTKKKKFLFPVITGIIITILMVSRGSTILLIVPMALLYMSHIKSQQNKKKKGFKKKIIIVVTMLVVIVGFGYVGDKRMLSSGYQDENAIMRIGKANYVFNELPSGFFWVYLYASSPFANLASQEYFDNIDKGDIGDFIKSSILPDFMVKHIDEDIYSKFNPKRITEELTVGTGFAFALVSFGFMGVFLLYSWMVFLIFIFSFLNKNFYIKSICAVLSSTAILMIFDNMFIFTSCVMQMLLLTIFTRVKIGKYYLM